MLKGFWNGSEPVTYVPISYEVREMKETPLHWQNSHVGERRQGIVVTTVETKERPNAEVFVIDNQHGDGYYKIFSTKGSPGAGHKSVSFPKDVRQLPDEDLIRDYHFQALMAEERLHDDYCMKVDPEGYEKIKGLREMITKNRKDNPDAFKIRNPYDTRP